MRNSTIKQIVGPCLDCTRNTFLTAGRCKICYSKHRTKVCADRKSERPAKEPVKTIKISASKKTSSLFDKSLSALLEIAQKHFNAYIRKRDDKGGWFVCISCNERKDKSKMDAGHYYSAGNHSFLRFNENNVHGQCRKCNSFMHGHLIPYRENLIKKIGLAEVEKLDAWRNFSMKWDKLQVIAIIQEYREKCKRVFFVSKNNTNVLKVLICIFGVWLVTR